MKKLISIIIIVTFTITTITKDSLALRPTSYRRTISTANISGIKPKPICSVAEETSAVLSNLFGKVLAEKRAAEPDDISKDLMDFCTTCIYISKHISFRDPDFFEGSYNILSSYKFYVIGTLLFFVLAELAGYLFSPVTFTIVSGMISGIALFTYREARGFEGSFFQITGKYLSQRPLFTGILAYMSFLIAGVLTILENPWLLLTLSGVAVLFSIYIWLALKILNEDRSRESFTLKHFLTETIEYNRDIAAKKELMLNSTQAMYFADKGDLIFREGVRKDYFHTIVSYLLTNNLMGTDMGSQHIRTDLDRLYMEEVIECVYIFYDNNKEQNNDEYIKWVHEPLNQYLEDGAETPEGTDTFMVTISRDKDSDGRMMPRFTFVIRPGKISLNVVDAIGAAA